MKNLWKKFALYAALPEMRLLWLFLPVVLIVLVVDFLFLPFIWGLISFFLFILLSATVVFNNLRLAKSNLEIKVERNTLSSLIGSLNDGVIAYDIDFKVLVFNRAAGAILQVPAAEVVGQTFSPEVARAIKSRLLAYAMFPSLAPIAVTRSQPDAPTQIADISLDNPQIELRVATTKIIDPAGKLLGFVKVIHDRTREVEVLKSKSEFISAAAHQLRTPLNSLAWAMETLTKESSLGDSARELISTSAKVTQKMLKIVNTLLDAAKIEEGRFGYQFESVELVAFLENILKEAAIFSREYKVNVYFEKPSEPSAVITADPAKLSMAFNNILDNAIKYNIENGTVTVKLERMADGPFMHISVSDTGIGIAGDDLKKLFTKFFRGGNAVAAQTDGNGLGMFITKNIVMRHGGKIWVESELNRGTTVHFTLPTDPKLIPQKEMVYEEY